MEAQTEHIPENIDPITRVHRGLARLYFGRVLESGNWLSNYSRDSISRMIHYDDLFPPSCDAELTLGELLATNPEYLIDTCTRIIGDQPTMIREEFLALFLEKFLDKNPDRTLQISKDINSLEPEKARKFLRILKNFLARHQIPAEDVFLALGIHILQTAHDQKLILLERNELKRIVSPA